MRRFQLRYEFGEGEPEIIEADKMQIMNSGVLVFVTGVNVVKVVKSYRDVTPLPLSDGEAEAMIELAN